ncbi:MAG: hypothetical protein HDT05_05650 [Bacteroidales bacterium]|nr:hypothetical protein [Bacteroidales bacterium]
MKDKITIKISGIFTAIIVALYAFSSYAQMPPSSLYTNLLVYKTDAVLDGNNNFVDFSGVDYFYLDMDRDGDLWALFYDFNRHSWIKNPCNLEGYEEDSLKYSTYNLLAEDIIFLISTNCSDLIMAKENSDLTLCYTIVNGSSSSPSYSNPSYTSPSYSGSGSYGGSGSYSSGSSGSGRTCISCSGSGKCKTCGGKGYYYHETGYYTGNSGKTRTDCPVCRATGNCGTCHGVGTIR